MRTTARRSRRSTCTDTTEPCHRWPSLHCMHGWLGPRTGPRPPQRAPDVNYGASPRTARDPPICIAAGTQVRTSRGRREWAICVRPADIAALIQPSRAACGPFLQNRSSGAPGVALAKSGAVVGKLSCDVEVASVPAVSSNMSKMTQRRSQTSPAGHRVPATQRRRQRRRSHDGIGALTLVPVEAEHDVGR